MTEQTNEAIVDLEDVVKQINEAKEFFSNDPDVPQKTLDAGLPPEPTEEDLVRQRRKALELDHLRLKELEVSVLYEELNTRNIAAVKSRMQHFITVKEIESKYNKLVEADRVANERAKQAQEQFAQLIQNQEANTTPVTQN